MYRLSKNSTTQVRAAIDHELHIRAVPFKKVLGRGQNLQTPAGGVCAVERIAVGWSKIIYCRVPRKGHA